MSGESGTAPKAHRTPCAAVDASIKAVAFRDQSRALGAPDGSPAADGATCTLSDCATAACSDAPLCNSPGVPTVPISSAERGCHVDADCARTTDRCDSCCEFLPIAANAQSAHEAALESACSDFAPVSVCDCPPTAEMALCIDELCELVAPESDCEDGDDNDLDGLVDCADSDCFGTLTCGTPWELHVPLGHQDCSTDADCTEVSTDCAGCCQYDPIATEYADAFREAFNDLCSDYSGEACDCEPRETVLSCVDAECQIIPKESSCGDDVDNDFDGATDCSDSDCESVEPCSAGVSPSEYEYPVPADYELCDVDADCTMVDTECGACCTYAPMALEFGEAFNAELESYCGDREDPSCEGCPELPLPTPACVEHRCTTD